MIEKSPIKLVSPIICIDQTDSYRHAQITDCVMLVLQSIQLLTTGTSGVSNRSMTAATEKTKVCTSVKNSGTVNQSLIHTVHYYNQSLIPEFTPALIFHRHNATSSGDSSWPHINTD